MTRLYHDRSRFKDRNPWHEPIVLSKNRPFGCPCNHSGRKEIAINTDNPQKIFQCHSYVCGFRGNLLTLMHGFLTDTKPTGGRLNGDEFQRVKKVLAGTGQHDVSSKALAPGPSDSPASTTPPPPKTPPANTPLIDSPEDRVRELHNIDEKLIRDVATMNPTAAAYIRRHPALYSESMTKWRCGYLPNDGGDKRGWSLRSSILYPVLSEQGKVLAWAGRDVQFEQKEKEYQQLSAAERSGKDPPAKHRFPIGFHNRPLRQATQHQSSQPDVRLRRIRNRRSQRCLVVLRRTPTRRASRMVSIDARQ